MMMMPSLKDDCRISLRNCFNSTRFIILFISTAALSFVMANSLALNFTIICMIKEPIGGEQDFIHQLNITNPEPLYTLGERSWLFSAIAIGNIIGTIPLTWSNNRFGVRKTFGVYGFISGISTLLLPLFVETNFILAFFARTLQGFGLAISLTSLGAIVSSWSSLEGAGTFISFLSMHVQFGAIMVMPISGALCTSSLGWPAVYYILGGFTLIFFILFILFYRDDPSLHFNVSQKEFDKIKAGRISLKVGEHPSVPYKRIIIDLPVIGIIVSCFGGSLGLQIMFQYGPTYLNKVLGFDLTKTGFAAALPYVLSVIVKIFAGPFSDLITCISDRGRIIFFNTMSQLPMSICFILMAAIPSEYGWIIQISYSLVNSFSGLNAVGVARCVQLMAQHHSHFIMTIMSLINSIVILILPPIVSFIAPDNTPEQWAIIFYIISVCIFLTMMFFNFTCQVTPRDWALEDRQAMLEMAPKKSSQGVTMEFEKPAGKVISGQIHNLQILPLDSPSEPIQGRSEVSLIVTKS